MMATTELTARLRKNPDVLFALIFGSRAWDRGAARADSDWDLAVYADDRLDDSRRFDLRLSLQADLADLGAFDVTILNDAPPLLAQRALQGRRVMVRDERAFVRFFVRVEALAGDERFWGRIHLNARARRLEEGRFGRP